MPEFCGRRFGSFFDTQLEWRIFRHKKAKYHQLLQEYGAIPSLLYTKKIGHNKRLMKNSSHVFLKPQNALHLHSLTRCHKNLDYKDLADTFGVISQNLQKPPFFASSQVWISARKELYLRMKMCMKELPLTRICSSWWFRTEYSRSDEVEATEIDERNRSGEEKNRGRGILVNKWDISKKKRQQQFFPKMFVLRNG